MSALAAVLSVLVGAASLVCVAVREECKVKDKETARRSGILSFSFWALSLLLMYVSGRLA